MPKTGRVAAAALALCGLMFSGSGASVSAAAPVPVWSEVPWPFPIDQWGKGTAFACKAADCGTQITVYIRAKIGFCNCSTGVADDEELDRISDFDLVGGQVSASAAGRPIAVAWMKGRSRPFDVTAAGAKLSAISVGFNDRCDAIVATAVVTPGRTTEVEPVLLELLNSRTVLRWAEVTLGL